MKRIVLAAALFLTATALFAYNVPYGGEELFRITSPELLSGAASASGGANFTVLPASIAYNPAIPAGEQRVTADLSGALLFNSHQLPIQDTHADSPFGGGFQAGVIIPTKIAVFSGTVSGLFSNFLNMDLGNSISFKAGVSKEVFERLSLGANVYGGGYWAQGDGDFSVGIDVGVLYEFGDLGIFKDARVGVAILNIGKNGGNFLRSTKRLYDGRRETGYPSFFTPRVSFASAIWQTDDLALSFSADLAFPSFQNVVFDAALGLDIADRVRVSCGWQANLREFIAGARDADITSVNVLSIGVSVKFGINTRGIAERNAEWEQSEIIPSVAYQALYSRIHDVSFGAHLKLGTQDTEGPEIILWDEE